MSVVRTSGACFALSMVSVVLALAAANPLTAVWLAVMVLVPAPTKVTLAELVLVLVTVATAVLELAIWMGAGLGEITSNTMGPSP
jgi:hypothetical protein